MEENPPVTTATETPPPINPSLLTFTTGKYHNPPPNTAVVTYKECLKNHAAGIGGHALDGCGEFMPSPTCTPLEPTSLSCAACGCHRNFHRRESANDFFATIEFHRHGGTSASPSPPPPPLPPPQPTNYYVPQVLLSLATAAGDQNHAVVTPGTPLPIKIENPSGRKRFRTKFSREQKEKMYLFAETIGWKMQRCVDKMVADFCNEIGIKRGVFKVWMHNNKNTFGRREKETIFPATAALPTAAAGGGSCESHEEDINVDGRENGGSGGSDGGDVHLKVLSNGSSSSS